MGWGDEGQPIGRKNLEAIKLVPMLDFKVITRKVHFNKVLESCHSDLTSRPPPPKKTTKNWGQTQESVCQEGGLHSCKACFRNGTKFSAACCVKLVEFYKPLKPSVQNTPWNKVCEM